ncbi:MAG: hypothetical protein WAK20_21240 [Candidatus Acidiferrum sp.]
MAGGKILVAAHFHSAIEQWEANANVTILPHAVFAGNTVLTAAQVTALAQYGVATGDTILTAAAKIAAVCPAMRSRAF